MAFGSNVYEMTTKLFGAVTEFIIAIFFLFRLYVYFRLDVRHDFE